MGRLDYVSNLFEAYVLANKIEGNPKEVYEPLNYILSLGGKKLRPKLLLFATDMFAGNATDALPFAHGIEVFHNFSLLHDDIMDKANNRRNKPTAHKVYGVNNTLLSGDLMLTHAVYLMTKAKNAKLAVVNEFLKTAVEVCEGQQFDMNFENNDEVTEKEYLKMIKLKTAVLFASGLKIGAMLANATEENCNNIYAFGINLGMAFQVQDDLLDTYGNEAEFGKKIGGDIEQNKRTLLYIYTYNNANETDKKALASLYNTNKNLGFEQKYKEVVNLFNKYNAKQLAIDLQNEYYQKSLEALANIKQASNNHIDELKALSNKMLSRKV